MSHIFSRYRYIILFSVISAVFILIYIAGRWANANEQYNIYALEWVTFRGSTIMIFAAISLIFVSVKKPVAAIISTLGFCMAIVLSEVIGRPLYEEARKGIESGYVPFYPWRVFIQAYIITLLVIFLFVQYRLKPFLAETVSLQPIPLPPDCAKLFA